MCTTKGSAVGGIRRTFVSVWKSSVVLEVWISIQHEATESVAEAHWYTITRGTIFSHAAWKRIFSRQTSLFSFRRCVILRGLVYIYIRTAVEVLPIGIAMVTNIPIRSIEGVASHTFLQKPSRKSTVFGIYASSILRMPRCCETWLPRTGTFLAAANPWFLAEFVTPLSLVQSFVLIHIARLDGILNLWTVSHRYANFVARATIPSRALQNKH